MEFCTCFRLFISSFFDTPLEPDRKSRKHKASHIFRSLRIYGQEDPRPLVEKGHDNSRHSAKGYGTVNEPYQRNDAMELNSDDLDTFWILLETDAE
jgi:hypothetical protein